MKYQDGSYVHYDFFNDSWRSVAQGGLTVGGALWYGAYKIADIWGTPSIRFHHQPGKVRGPPAHGSRALGRERNVWLTVCTHLRSAAVIRTTAK